MKAVGAGSRDDCPVGWIAEGIAHGRNLGCDLDIKVNNVHSSVCVEGARSSRGEAPAVQSNWSLDHCPTAP